jgi:hypothetical protein
MNVNELIRQLKKLDPELPVFLGERPLTDDELVIHDSPVWGIQRLVIE